MNERNERLEMIASGRFELSNLVEQITTQSETNCDNISYGIHRL